jgi:predicted lipoprotein with Yx(FWY)xxD motif
MTLLALAAIGLAACGSGGKDATPAASSPAMTTAPAPTTPPTTAPSRPAVTVADTTLGKLLVDANGRTLYAYTRDVDGTSTCTGPCAMAWPPATVTGDAVLGTGTTATLSIIDAPGGGTMLKAGKWPLYRFAGDTAPGDTNGQGSGGVWFAVGADGKLIKS